MTSPAVADAEPACPGAPAAPPDAPSSAGAPRSLRVELRPFDGVEPALWERLVARTPWATPFARWPFHRAWWDAYGDNAHDQTLVVVDETAGDVPVAIAPLMHRHEVEPTDAATHTTIRHGSAVELTPVPPTAKAVFFGASYHADYATILTAPDDLSAVAEAIVEHLADAAPDPDHPEPWDVVDLRRLRCGDPAADALAAAFGRREIDAGWTVNLEREDVCPVASLPDGGPLDDYLATLDKKARHEIRRKLRRAEGAGGIELVESPDPFADLEAFIDLHQARWGDDGLFPPTEGGRQSRRFVERLFGCFDAGSGPRLSFLEIGGTRVAAGIHFEDATTAYYYNAGLDPDARSLSPGVVLVAAYVERALERGLTRFDFLRGDESYKYEWGARDEPIQRLLVRRTDDR